VHAHHFLALATLRLDDNAIESFKGIVSVPKVIRPVAHFPVMSAVAFGLHLHVLKDVPVSQPDRNKADT
jgi:hypothetical protein